MIDISKFNKSDFNTFVNYVLPFPNGEISIRVGDFGGNASIPNSISLDINSYQKILVYLYIDSSLDHFKDKLKHFVVKYSIKEKMSADYAFLVSPIEAEQIINICLGKESSCEEEVIGGKCCICGIFDKYAPIKNGVFYCYKHFC